MGKLFSSTKKLIVNHRNRNKPLLPTKTMYLEAEWRKKKSITVSFLYGNFHSFEKFAAFGERQKSRSQLALRRIFSHFSQHLVTSSADEKFLNFPWNPKKVWRWGLIKKFHATFQRLSTRSDNLHSEHRQISSQTMPLFRSVSRCRPKTPSAPCTTSCTGKPCRCGQSPKTCPTQNCCCKRSRPRPNCSNKGCCCKKSEQKKVTCVNKSCEQPAPCPTSCCSVATKTCPDRSRSRCPKAKCPSTCSETVRQTCSPSPCAPKSSSKTPSCVRSGCSRRKPCMDCCQSGNESKYEPPRSTSSRCKPPRSTSQCQSSRSSSKCQRSTSQCQSPCSPQCQPKLVIRCLDEPCDTGDYQKPKKRWSFRGKKWTSGTQIAERCYITREVVRFMSWNVISNNVE